MQGCREYIFVYPINYRRQRCAVDKFLTGKAGFRRSSYNAITRHVPCRVIIVQMVSVLDIILRAFVARCRHMAEVHHETIIGITGHAY